MGVLGGMLGLVILGLDISAIVDCVGGSNATGMKILWLILIILLPVVGMMLYSLLGRK